MVCIGVYTPGLHIHGMARNAGPAEIPGRELHTQESHVPSLPSDNDLGDSAGRGAGTTSLPPEMARSHSGATESAVQVTRPAWGHCQ